MACDCLFHCYHVVHICDCGQLIPHSQAAWDEHKDHNGMYTISSDLYQHGDTPETLRQRVEESGRDFIYFGAAEAEVRHE